MTGTHKLKWWALLAVFFLLLLLYLPRAYRGTIEAQILDKEVNRYYEDSVLVEDYLIYTEGEVFQNTDDFFYFKNHSAVLFQQLRVGEVYRLTITGWELPIYSKHRNIIAVERVVNAVVSPDADKQEKSQATDSTSTVEEEKPIEKKEPDSVVDTLPSPVMEL